MDNYDPWAPASNSSKSWEKDDFGRWKYVGLSFEESEALKEWLGVRLDGENILYPIVPGGKCLSSDYVARMRTLLAIHERHRQRLLGKAQ